MPGFLVTMMGAGLSAGQANAINGYGTAGQTATGATQGTAFPLTTEFTEFTTVAASTGALLPAPTGVRPPGTGDAFLVANQGANALLVYPPVGFQIGLAGANTGVSVASGKVGYFVAKGNGNFWGGSLA
jgi:hypothetical protein